MNHEKINIAQILYAAYPSADLLPIDPDRDCRDLPTLLTKVTGENIGDGLFTFMVIEIVEGGESTLSGAIQVMERALQDVETVLDALRAACIGQKRPASEVSKQLNAATWRSEVALQEQSPDFPQKVIALSLLAENGQLWIRPQGYGEKCTTDGEGSPVGMEIWQNRLRLIVFDDINREDPRIIDLENAKESHRIDAS